MPQAVINDDRYDEFLVTFRPVEAATQRVASSASSTVLAPASTTRRCLMINNQSSSILYLSFAATATAANSFLAMQPNSFLFMDRQLMTTGAITGIWSSANGAAHVTTFS